MASEWQRGIPGSGNNSYLYGSSVMLSGTKIGFKMGRLSHMLLPGTRKCGRIVGDSAAGAAAESVVGRFAFRRPEEWAVPEAGGCRYNPEKMINYENY